ncbi:hypothetical protein EYF80_039218 [Liparis tanakae]|uniref:Uncharacterized protein n=1 Tax=Liparis tanakae TaxID=230148 RepID=A0A4Z2GAM3_9TELE|nr:hypothetical protein EYF80_039218 [Liparis tanakae]
MSTTPTVLSISVGLSQSLVCSNNQSNSTEYKALAMASLQRGRGERGNRRDFYTIGSQMGGYVYTWGVREGPLGYTEGSRSCRRSSPADENANQYANLVRQLGERLPTVTL